MKLWIRVDAALPRDPEVAELAACIGVKKTEAIGLLTCVWSAIAEHRPSGDVSGISPATLEDWALFEPRGKVKRGTFAAQFTRLFTRDGFVRGWTDRQGKLIERMEKDRKRKQQPPEPSTENPQSFHGNSAPTERNGTEQYGTEESTTTTAHADLRAKLPDEYRPDLDAFMRGIGAADRQLSWIKSIESHLAGDRPPRVNGETVGRCIRQFVGNGDRPNWRLFERYLQTESATNGRPVLVRANDGKGEGLLLIGELRSKRIHHAAPQGSGVYVIPRPEYDSLPQHQRRAIDAIGGLHKIANAPDEQFPILASQFAQILTAAQKPTTEDAVA